jgi:hypothetical protein
VANWKLQNDGECGTCLREKLDHTDAGKQKDQRREST